LTEQFRPSGISAIVEYSFCIDVIFGVNKFYEELQRFKLRIFQNPDHYGLSLILGGAESNLWICVELTQVYLRL
jgi:membrane carboxypeptidase/penicillin-binding protein PbpC